MNTATSNSNGHVDDLVFLEEYAFICEDNETAAAVAMATPTGLNTRVWPSKNPRGAARPDLKGWKVIVVSGSDPDGQRRARTRKAAAKRAGATEVREWVLFGLGGEFPTLAEWREAFDLRKTLLIDQPWLKPPEPEPEPEPDKKAPSSNGDHRPVVFISTEEADVNDRAIDALKADPSVYQRNFKLITIARDSKPKGASDVRRPEGTPVIRPIQAARLREVLTRNVQWKTYGKDQDGKPQPVKAHPPVWSVNAILAREEWPSIRYLLGITETPTLRADGSVIEAAGYDQRTGLLYVPDGPFPPVPAKPSQDDARKAAERLLDLVVDFPFKAGHKAAWLAALLTPLGRFLIDGAVPLFLFESNTSGAGKTLLCDVISIINTGRVMTRTGYYHDPIEMDKQIVATALGGDRIVLFDNLENGGRFGNSSLDRALTGRTYRGRVLGKTEMTPDLDLCCVFYGTGNNLTLCGDIPRRLINCRLESPMDRPEERSGFIIAELLRHVTDNRGRLVVDAITILRAYILAGKPAQKLTPMDFTAWSGLIRNAVFWATGMDPAEGRKDLSESNPDRQHETAFVEGWLEVQAKFEPGGMTSATLIRTLVAKGNETMFAVMRDALANMWPKVKPGDLPSSGSIGMKIQAIRGKVYEGKRFECVTEVKKIKVWKVALVGPSGGSSGSSGSVSPNAHAAARECACTGDIPGDGKETHQTHQTHQGSPDADWLNPDPSPF